MTVPQIHVDKAKSNAGKNMPSLVEVLPQHRLDKAKLGLWLSEYVPDLGELRSIRQFQGGQSNPTYLVEGIESSCVLRKQPPGVLLVSAHAVDREFMIIQAMASTPVPVPRAYALCEDTAVLGASFYAMEFVPGRVLTDPKLANSAPNDRTPIYIELAQTLAAIHAVDWRAGSLKDFGKAENYLARQVKRWSRQFATSGIESRDMSELNQWVEAHIPASDAIGEECTVVHGDYRLGNAIYDETSPRLLAVLDWELATIGHPLADLSYNCLAWRLPDELNGLKDHVDPILPSEANYLAAYCKASGRPDLPQFEFFIAFSLFRLAAILAGVYRRAMDGNATDARGLDAGRRFQLIARIGRNIALNS